MDYFIIAHYADKTKHLRVAKADLGEDGLGKLIADIFKKTIPRADSVTVKKLGLPYQPNLTAVEPQSAP